MFKTVIFINKNTYEIINFHPHDCKCSSRMQQNRLVNVLILFDVGNFTLSEKKG